MKTLLLILLTFMLMSYTLGQEKPYCLDSVEVAKLLEICIEHEQYKQDRTSLLTLDSLNQQTIQSLKTIISTKDTIITAKELQIQLLENTPVKVETTGIKWYHVVLTAVGALGVGFATGTFF